MTDAELIAECERRGYVCLKKWTEPPGEEGPKFVLSHRMVRPGVNAWMILRASDALEEAEVAQQYGYTLNLFDLPKGGAS